MDRRSLEKASNDVQGAKLKFQIPVRDAGICLLVISLPFMYYPKVLEGDTQPWVAVAVLVALITYRPSYLLRRKDLGMLMVALLCVAIYGLRSESYAALVRQAYIYCTFVALWIVCQRDQGDYLTWAFKITITIWFVVGVVQYFLVSSGYSFEMGRYVPGRSGVPSLTAEASYFGSLSLIQSMYLLEQGSRRHAPFIVMGFLSVILSGSVLAMLLLIFPLWRLRFGWKILVLSTVVFLSTVQYSISDAGVMARIVAIFSKQEFGLEGILLDASLNLRLGHLYFTLVENLVPSLFLYSPVSFMEHYNEFAFQSGIFIPTGSDFILPAIGELIYGGGVGALILLILLVRRAAVAGGSRWMAVQRVAFVVACLLNPISISNPFLVAYVQGGNLSKSQK